MSSRLVFAFITATATAALAQEHAEPAPTPAVIQYDFEEELVEGRVVVPSPLMVQSRTSSAQASLIEIRQHFRDRMISDAEAL